MKLAVVTGGTGHVGNVLVRHLIEQKVRTRVLLRRADGMRALDGLDVERVAGDVLEPPTLDEAFDGADVVFHVAGLVSITTGREAALMRTNVEGTRGVLEACKRARVRRLVYASSVHALPEPAGPILDEAGGFDPALAYGPYGKSKAAASKLVQDAARNGELDAVLVLPTGCVGPWDFRPSDLGAVVAAVGRRRLPATVTGGHDFVDVRDVAAGTLAAAERGRTGEAYLLNGGWVSAADFCAEVARVAGVKPPPMNLPLWVARAAAVFGPPWERVTGRRAMVTPYSVHTISRHHRVSVEKAERELGFAARPVLESFADAWQWLATYPASPLRAR